MAMLNNQRVLFIKLWLSIELWESDLAPQDRSAWHFKQKNHSEGEWPIPILAEPAWSWVIVVCHDSWLTLVHHSYGPWFIIVDHGGVLLIFVR